jgi:hypothetical protein
MDSELKQKENFLIIRAKIFHSFRKRTRFLPFITKHSRWEKANFRKKKIAGPVIHAVHGLFIRTIDLFRMAGLSGTVIKITFNPHTFPHLGHHRGSNRLTLLLTLKTEL